MPVFFESGLLILIPVAFGIARKTGKSVFCYSIPLLAGLAIGHAFVPPTPVFGKFAGNNIPFMKPAQLVVAFLVAAAVRVSVGSATVSMTMAAGIIASMPMVSGLSQLQLATLTIAIAAGGTAFRHVNDSGFWLSKSLFEVDEKTNLKTWTVMETIVGLVGIVGATIVWFIVS